MKIFKKNALGFVFISLVALFLMLFLPAKKAVAADFTPADIKNATYTFLDGGNISVKYPFASAPVVFTDRQITDGTRNFKPLDDGTFCDPGTVNDQGGVKGNLKYGINIADKADLTKAKISAQIKVAPYVAQCRYSDNDKAVVLANITIDNPDQLAATDFQWDGSDITTLNGAKDSDTYKLLPGTNDRVYTTKGGKCEGNVIFLDQAKGNRGQFYSIAPNNLGPKGDLDKTPIGIYFDPNCAVLAGPLSVTIAGKAGTGAAGGAATVSPQGQSCELDSGGFSLAWLMCPLLAAGNDFVNGPDGNSGLIGLFEKQLSFQVDRDLNSNGSNDVQTSWSLIKNIASAALVIIMLVMIFSQAISAGPFDAYTVRKLLPRLVAAVILMQLSWYILAWVIDFFDDMANSLVDLLYAPFGGSDAMNLGHLLKHAHIETKDAIAINFVAFVGLIGLGLAALPALLLMVLAVATAVLTALIVLIMRKIIIILCLILAPLALLAWILPGTQRYWKLWYDNLLKILFMYPLVVGLVAAGHIFAYIVGTQGNGTFLNLIFIVVGVFGPLFLIPKTFKWGGQAMSLASGAISSATNRFGGRESSLGKGVQSWAERRQGAAGKKYDPNKGVFNRGFRRVQSGHAIPFSKRSQRLAIAAGDKWQQEEDDMGLAYGKRAGEKVQEEGYDAAVLNEDGTGFAKYNRDEATRDLLDKDGNVAYKYKGLDDEGQELFAEMEVDEATGALKEGEITDKRDKAQKIDVDTYDEADKKRLYGVQAMKQKWVDLMDDDSVDETVRKMMARQLTATSSWPEIQGSLSKKGNKVLDMDAWNKSITTSTDEFPRVLRSRVDGAPHIDTYAKNQLKIHEAEREAEAKRKGEQYVPLTKKQAKDFISQQRILYSVEKQMSNEDIATQSDGYWEEVARVASIRDKDGNLTKEAVAVQKALQDRFQSIHDMGGTAPQQLLGHLVGGSVQKYVDKALGPGVGIKEYVAHGPVGGATSTATIQTQVESTLPRAEDLSNPTVRAQYKTSLLTTSNPDRAPGATPIIGPSAETLAQAIAYDVGTPEEQAYHVDVLNDLKFSAAASPKTAETYNKIIDTIHEAYQKKYNEKIQKAIAEESDPAKIAAIRAAAEDEALKGMDEFKKI